MESDGMDAMGWDRVLAVLTDECQDAFLKNAEMVGVLKNITQIKVD